MFILAIAPILVILILMVGFRWKASRAGGLGYLVALLISWIWFGINLETLAYAHAKAVFLIMDVLLIIWTAYLLYRVVAEAGGIEILSTTLPHLTGDKGMQALLIGWIFASFLQGVGGFGVPTAVIAPILVGLGFSPLNAVVIPSLGHTWAFAGWDRGCLGSRWLENTSKTVDSDPCHRRGDVHSAVSDSDIGIMEYWWFDGRNSRFDHRYSAGLALPWKK